MLQLAEDMLGESKNNSQHLLVWLRILRDYLISLPKEWIAHHERQFARTPKRFLIHQLVWVLLLLGPLLFTVFGAPFVGQIYVETGFWAFWLDPTTMGIWLRLLPFLAALVALYAVAIWLLARHHQTATRRKRRRVAALLVTLLLLIALGGITFSGFITTAQILADRDTEKQKIASLQRENEHPSLADDLQ